VYAFPRPIEKAQSEPVATTEKRPIIGTFGLATIDKGFERVVAAVSDEFEQAIVRINIPFGTYADESRAYANELGARCLSMMREGLEVVVTHDYFDKQELVAWCQQNTLNCFLYHRNMPGLAATTDQAVSSGRPLAVSSNDTFRHLLSYIHPYPLWSLRESIAYSREGVSRMQQDWSQEKFAQHFERVLDELLILKRTRSQSESSRLVRLPVKSEQIAQPTKRRWVDKISIRDFVPPIIGRVKRRLMRESGNISEIIAEAPAAKAPLIPFVHSAFGSYSQHNEDLLIDLIFESRRDGFYVDVGANDPVFNNNTQRFYLRGWRGVNAEPGPLPFQKLVRQRPKDINLNVAIGPKRGNMTFYHVANDSTLSSFDKVVADRMAAAVRSTVRPEPVEVLTLRDIFEEHAQGRKVDFLSVDAEGYDLEVLKSNDWKLHRPAVVLVEMDNDPKRIADFLSSVNYVLVFNSPVNGLFINATDAAIRKWFSAYPLS
jgi:FkbM family methyltransferase